MDLTPREKDKLLVAVAAMVARRRLERGVKLNYPEAVALITDFVLEGARDGRSVAQCTTRYVSDMSSGIYFSIVMPGLDRLDPGIHVSIRRCRPRCPSVDCRVKPGQARA